MKNFNFLKNPKERNFFGIGIACFAVLFLIYAYYCQTFKRIEYQAFDFSKTGSWKETDKGIYRTVSKGESDTTLLSKDVWKDFDISLDIDNPRNCGLVFNYEDALNFYFVYFRHKTNSILIGSRLKGKTSIKKQLYYPSVENLHCRLQKKNQTVLLSINNKLITNMNVNSDDGRLGLMIKEAYVPRMVFKNISLEGRTLSHGHMKINESSEKTAYPLLPVIFMYTGLVAASFYIASFCKRYIGEGLLNAQYSIKDWINIKSASIVHLAIAVFMFWPFIFKGHILVSSADNLAEILPLFVFSKHNFASIINGTSLSLWNPYSHNGVPFFSNHWFMVYYPLNWIVFLFSDKNVLLALTARQFIEVFLVGICAYMFFSSEMKSKKWALFSSIVYQMCSLVIFSLSVFPAISLYFAMTWTLYLVWTIKKRRAVLNYTLLTLAFIFVFTSANVAFIFYGILAIFLICAYRIFSDKQSIKYSAGIVSVSFLTASLISIIRMLPCLIGVLNSSRIVENFYTLHDRFFLLTRLFVPEITGWFGSGWINALQSKNLNLIFYQANLPSNPQNTFFVYFGIFPALLLIASLFIKEKGSFYFWKVYSFIVLAFGLLFQPFWGFLSILTFPLNHFSYYLIIIPIGVCALVGHAGSYIEERKPEIKNFSGKFIVILLAIEAYILVIVTY